MCFSDLESVNNPGHKSCPAFARSARGDRALPVPAHFQIEYPSRTRSFVGGQPGPRFRLIGTRAALPRYRSLCGRRTTGLASARLPRGSPRQVHPGRLPRRFILSFSPSVYSTTLKIYPGGGSHPCGYARMNTDATLNVC